MTRSVSSDGDKWARTAYRKVVDALDEVLSSLDWLPAGDASARGGWRTGVFHLGVAPDRELTDRFVHGQAASVQWPADPPDPVPARRVAVGDRVWTYDSRSREIVMHVVVDSDPDCEQGEVSPGSAIGSALLGGAEGEEREVLRPDRESGRIRIVLIGDRDRP